MFRLAIQKIPLLLFQRLNEMIHSPIKMLAHAIAPFTECLEDSIQPLLDPRLQAIDHASQEIADEFGAPKILHL